LKILSSVFLQLVDGFEQAEQQKAELWVSFATVLWVVSKKAAILTLIGLKLRFISLFDLFAPALVSRRGRGLHFISLTLLFLAVLQVCAQIVLNASFNVTFCQAHRSTW